MASQVAQFSTGNATGEGWQTLVDNMNAFFVLPGTNIIVQDLHIERRRSARNGQDQHTAYLAYRVSDAAIRVNYVAAYNTIDPELTFDEWFAAYTDANAAVFQPLIVACAPVTPFMDTEMGRQYLILGFNKTLNPNGLGSTPQVFIGDPAAPIAPQATGLVALQDSEGDALGNVTVRNISNTLVWNPGDRSYVLVDTQGATPQFMAIPLCCG